MIIEDMQQTLNLLSDIEYFFKNIDNTEKNLKANLVNIEGQQEDLLHEIELSKLNAIEIMNIYKQLENVRKERRKIKDKLELINTLKSYTNKFIEKGICGETKDVIKNIETLRNNQENRQYTPRILKDLKCAKKRKEQKCV